MSTEFEQPFGKFLVWHVQRNVVHPQHLNLPVPTKPLNWVRVLVWVENLYPDPDLSTTQHETQRVYTTHYNA